LNCHSAHAGDLRSAGAPTSGELAAGSLGFFHFRDRDDFEVDIVLEQGRSAIAGVEVEAAASVGEADLRGLRKLKDAAGPRFVAGVVLYGGSATVNFGDGLFAVPLRKLWEST
jgi:predicted AAA+ superfamily ATPase